MAEQNSSITLGIFYKDETDEVKTVIGDSCYPVDLNDSVRQIFKEGVRISNGFIPPHRILKVETL